MIDATIILLFIFVLFIFLALVFKDVYVFGVSAFMSIVVGMKFIIDYSETTDAWAFTVVGLAFLFFGIWLIFASYKYAGEVPLGQ